MTTSYRNAFRNLTATPLFIALSLTAAGCLGDEDVDVEADDDVASSPISVNSSPDFLVVYSNNIENLADGTCDGDGTWTRLFNYVKAQSRSPDIFLVQQVSNQTQLNTLVKKMTDELPGVYAGVIALGDPTPWMYCASNSESSPHSCSTSSCSFKKKQQTNAVIYRSDRLSPVGSPNRWQSDRYQDGGCSNSNQLRVHNVGILLHDRIANKNVAAASFHWPTDKSDGDRCAAENSRETVAEISELGGSLKILGGDANQSKGTQGWWQDARDSGFRDPIFETCPASGCPDSTSTVGSVRIDYLLVKGSHGFSGAKTISESSTGGSYSNHRALRVNVKY
jgi:hypothetical protein